jgi:hypothetical protein
VKEVQNFPLLDLIHMWLQDGERTARAAVVMASLLLGSLPRAANCCRTGSAVQGLPAITTVNRFYEHQMLPNFTQYYTSLYSDTPFHSES